MGMLESLKLDSLSSEQKKMLAAVGGVTALVALTAYGMSPPKRKPKPPKIKIGYWTIRGLAAPLRMMCNYAGVDFYDEQYDIKREGEGWDAAEWTSAKPALAAKNPLINLPYVEINGALTAQSNACGMALAKVLGLALPGKEVATEELACEVMDLRNAAVRVFYGKSEEALKTHLDTVVAKNLPKFEAALAKTSGAFLLGKKPTFPDFGLWEMLDEHERLATSLKEKSPLAGFKKLKTFYATIRNAPELIVYFAAGQYALPINNKMALFGADGEIRGNLYRTNPPPK